MKATPKTYRMDSLTLSYIDALMQAYPGHSATDIIKKSVTAYAMQNLDKVKKYDETVRKHEIKKMEV